MIRLEMRNYSMILIDKQLEYQLYHLVKFINMNYLTGEDMLPSNQQQIIEQARFTYSPLGKAFEKQRKTIEDQGQKQVDALESLKTKEQTKAITYDDESLEQKEESYNKLFDEKLDEIQELSREIDYKNLNYNFTTKDSGSINFIKFKGPFSLFKEMLKIFMIRGKKLLVYLIITQKLNLNLFIDQNMMKLREEDLKY